MGSGEIKTHQYHGEDIDEIFHELKLGIKQQREKQSASTAVSFDDLVKPSQPKES